MKVKIKQLRSDASMPYYATPGSAAFDLIAMEDMTLQLFETKVMKTGFSMEIPVGYELQIRPRSGSSLKTGLRITNTPGTIDSDYRGEIGIIIQLLPDTMGTVSYTIKKGDRIAQAALCQVFRAEFEFCDELSDTARGAGGFGSTGQ